MDPPHDELDRDPRVALQLAPHGRRLRESRVSSRRGRHERPYVSRLIPLDATRIGYGKRAPFLSEEEPFLIIVAAEILRFFLRFVTI